jgi:hypothetical protein
MWAVARFDLSLTSDEFYALTPRQFDALVKRHERKNEHIEFLFAQLTSYGINFSMCRPQEPTSPRDFMPSQFDKEAPLSSTQKRVRMTKQVRRQVAMQLSTGLGALRRKSK